MEAIRISVPNSGAYDLSRWVLILEEGGKAYLEITEEGSSFSYTNDQGMTRSNSSSDTVEREVLTRQGLERWMWKLRRYRSTRSDELAILEDYISKYFQEN